MQELSRNGPLPAVISLIGPTAVGKTALALALHDRLPVEIVSVDAAQVYRGMDIGTAKPSKDELARAPHRLIDICDPADPYSAARFCVDARREIDSIVARGRVPMLVGGTMFYFRALEYGLSALPSANTEIRERLSREADVNGWPALHARLAAVDPASAARIKPGDGQRIQRALEIHELMGLPASELIKRGEPVGAPYRFIKIGLLPEDRGALHDRIETRFGRMLEQGLVEEVEALYRRGDLTPDLPSIRVVGYRQVWKYLTENVNYTEMAASAVSATRQLAKRQMTWMRAYPGIKVFEVGEYSINEDVLVYLQKVNV